MTATQTLAPSGPAAPAPREAGGVVYLSPPAACQMADEWFDLAVADHFWYQWRLRAITAVLGAAGLTGPVLEVGCGNAAARNQLEAHHDCDIDGCDLNDVALRRARPGRGELYCYDIHARRPEWAEAFQTVLLLDTLEHISDPVRFLRSVAYHLRPDGKVLITVPAMQWLYSRYDQVDGHVKRYAVGVLRRELEAAGFALGRHAYWGLSLLPIIALRKLVLRFYPPERAIAVGFQPSSSLVDGVLRTLMRVECGLGPRMPIGAALVALARKEGPA